MQQKRVIKEYNTLTFIMRKKTKRVKSIFILFYKNKIKKIVKKLLPINIIFYNIYTLKIILGHSTFIQQKLNIFGQKVSQKLAKKRLTLSKNTS